MFKKIFHNSRFSFYDTIMLGVSGSQLSSGNIGVWAAIGGFWIVTRVAMDMHYKDKS